MQNKNIIYNHTLDQYNKRYGAIKQKLLKYTKKQVEDYDKEKGHFVKNEKTHTIEYKNYLLKDRKWWYIKNVDSYYEIPKFNVITWFRGLNIGVQIGACVLGAGAITTAIVVPIVMSQR